MTTPRAIGLATLSVLLALALLSRCASGGSASSPSGTPAAEDAVAPEAQPAEPAVPAATPAAVPALPGRVDFTAQILPLLQQKCFPCHFPGGRMYDRLPFDQEGTIRLLGTQLFSRLRDPLDQEMVRAYLEQP